MTYNDAVTNFYSQITSILVMKIMEIIHRLVVPVATTNGCGLLIFSSSINLLFCSPRSNNTGEHRANARTPIKMRTFSMFRGG